MKLDGVKVLDLSSYLPGPMLTLMMADHGASVLRVEPPGGEPSRTIGQGKNGVSVWFRNTHRGKQAIRLDLKTEADLAVFHSLARQADVVIESYRPGVADRLGVGYAAVSADNPRVVYASITAFGQDGPYRDRPAHDLAIQALAGVVSLNEGQDGKPTAPHMASADALGSLTALSGILMALLRRERTGRGDYLDVAMLDSVTAWTPNLTGSVFALGEPPKPKDGRSWGGSAFTHLYECADGRWLCLAGPEPKFVRNLLEGLGRPDLAPYASLPPGPGQAPLRDALRETFLTRSLCDWERWFEGRDVAYAPVRDLKEAFDDPALIARGMLAWDGEGAEVVGTAIRFHDEPAQIDPRIPGLEADFAAIIRQGWSLPS